MLTLIKSPKCLYIVLISLVTGLWKKVFARNSSEQQDKGVDADTIINVVIFSVGIVLFNQNVSWGFIKPSSGGKAAIESSPICIAFALGGAFCDSLSGFFQIDVRRKFKPSPFAFMEAISFYTFIVSLIACK